MSKFVLKINEVVVEFKKIKSVNVLLKPIVF